MAYTPEVQAKIDQLRKEFNKNPFSPGNLSEQQLYHTALTQINAEKERAAKAEEERKLNEPFERLSALMEEMKARQDQEAKAAGLLAERSALKRKQTILGMTTGAPSTRGGTLLTSPLGVATPAPVARKTILGG